MGRLRWEGCWGTRKGGKEKGAQGGERRRGWCVREEGNAKKSKVRDLSGGEGRKRRGLMRKSK